MIVIASAIRLLTDRPSWSPWSVAIGGGLAFVSSSGTIIALLTATIAALSTWSVSRRLLRGWLEALMPPPGRAVLLAGGLAALVGGTAGFMDLRGVGFPLGDLWGGAAAIMVPAPFPSRNLGALLAYAGPFLLLALLGFVRGARDGDRVALFLGEWSFLLIAVAVAFGQSVLTLALLPVAPTAVLAGLALRDVPFYPAAYRLSGAAWAVIGLGLALSGVVVLVTAQTIGTAGPARPAAVGVAVLALALVVLMWRQELPAGERVPALIVLGGTLLAIFTLGAIGRLSYGGSPMGTEMLTRQETAPELRALFNDLNIAAMGDASRVLVYDSSTPIEVRWYGRYIPQVAADRRTAGNAFTFRAAPTVAPGSPAAPTGRSPWTVVSQISRSDLHPLGILRWMVSRHGLVEGRGQDIIVAR